jgi:hypothetical protein
MTPTSVSRPAPLLIRMALLGFVVAEGDVLPVVVLPVVVLPVELLPELVEFVVVLPIALAW